jgi:hypothetical protein
MAAAAAVAAGAKVAPKRPLALTPRLQLLRKIAKEIMTHAAAYRSEMGVPAVDARQYDFYSRARLSQPPGLTQRRASNLLGDWSTCELAFWMAVCGDQHTEHRDVTLRALLSVLNNDYDGASFVNGEVDSENALLEQFAQLTNGTCDFEEHEVVDSDDDSDTDAAPPKRYWWQGLRNVFESWAWSKTGRLKATACCMKFESELDVLQGMRAPDARPAPLATAFLEKTKPRVDEKMIDLKMRTRPDLVDDEKPAAAAAVAAVADKKEKVGHKRLVHDGAKPAKRSKTH